MVKIVLKRTGLIVGPGGLAHGDTQAKFRQCQNVILQIPSGLLSGPSPVFNVILSKPLKADETPPEPTVAGLAEPKNTNSFVANIKRRAAPGLGDGGKEISFECLELSAIKISSSLKTEYTTRWAALSAQLEPVNNVSFWREYSRLFEPHSVGTARTVELQSRRRLIIFLLHVGVRLAFCDDAERRVQGRALVSNILDNVVDEGHGVQNILTADKATRTKAIGEIAVASEMHDKITEHMRIVESHVEFIDKQLGHQAQQLLLVFHEPNHQDLGRPGTQTFNNALERLQSKRKSPVTTLHYGAVKAKIEEIDSKYELPAKVNHPGYSDMIGKIGEKKSPTSRKIEKQDVLEAVELLFACQERLAQVMEQLTQANILAGMFWINGSSELLRQIQDDEEQCVELLARVRTLVAVYNVQNGRDAKKVTSSTHIPLLPTESLSTLKGNVEFANKSVEGVFNRLVQSSNEFHGTQYSHPLQDRTVDHKFDQLAKLWEAGLVDHAVFFRKQSLVRLASTASAPLEQQLKAKIVLAWAENREAASEVEQCKLVAQIISCEGGVEGLRALLTIQGEGGESLIADNFRQLFPDGELPGDIMQELIQFDVGVVVVPVQQTHKVFNFTLLSEQLKLQVDKSPKSTDFCDLTEASLDLMIDAPVSDPLNAEVELRRMKAKLIKAHRFLETDVSVLVILLGAESCTELEKGLFSERPEARTIGQAHADVAAAFDADTITGVAEKLRQMGDSRVQSHVFAVPRVPPGKSTDALVKIQEAYQKAYSGDAKKLTNIAYLKKQILSPGDTPADVIYRRKHAALLLFRLFGKPDKVESFVANVLMKGFDNPNSHVNKKPNATFAWMINEQPYERYFVDGDRRTKALALAVELQKIAASPSGQDVDISDIQVPTDLEEPLWKALVSKGVPNPSQLSSVAHLKELVKAYTSKATVNVKKDGAIAFCTLLFLYHSVDHEQDAEAFSNMLLKAYRSPAFNPNDFLNEAKRLGFFSDSSYEYDAYPRLEEFCGYCFGEKGCKSIEEIVGEIDIVRAPQQVRVSRAPSSPRFAQVEDVAVSLFEILSGRESTSSLVAGLTEKSFLPFFMHRLKDEGATVVERETAFIILAAHQQGQASNEQLQQIVDELLVPNLQADKGRFNALKQQHGFSKLFSHDSYSTLFREPAKVEEAAGLVLSVPGAAQGADSRNRDNALKTLGYTKESCFVLRVSEIIAKLDDPPLDAKASPDTVKKSAVNALMMLRTNFAVGSEGAIEARLEFLAQIQQHAQFSNICALTGGPRTQSRVNGAKTSRTWQEMQLILMTDIVTCLMMSAASQAYTSELSEHLMIAFKSRLGQNGIDKLKGNKGRGGEKGKQVANLLQYGFLKKPGGCCVSVKADPDLVSVHQQARDISDQTIQSLSTRLDGRVK